MSELVVNVIFGDVTCVDNESSTEKARWMLVGRGWFASLHTRRISGRAEFQSRLSLSERRVEGVFANYYGIARKSCKVVVS